MNTCIQINEEVKVKQNNHNSIKDIVLLILLLSYTLISILLDSTFTLPKSEALKGIITIGHWVISAAIMSLLAYKTQPEAFADINNIIKKIEKPLLISAVVLTAIMLSLNIRAGGNLRSPYISFLSSFPIYYMILLFDRITLSTCLCGLSIAVGSLLFVYAGDLLLGVGFGYSIAAPGPQIDAFLAGSKCTCLTIAVLILTVLSNLLSIYFGTSK